MGWADPSAGPGCQDQGFRYVKRSKVGLWSCPSLVISMSPLSRKVMPSALLNTPNKAATLQPDDPPRTAQHQGEHEGADDEVGPTGTGQHHQPCGEQDPHVHLRIVAGEDP